jgi:hypothetical protein
MHEKRIKIIAIIFSNSFYGTQSPNPTVTDNTTVK